MRFKAAIKNISTFTKLTASLSSLGKEVWIRLDNDQVRFTVIPERGSQVWAVLSRDTIFETYIVQSAVENNTINLRVSLAPLHRALRSALTASSASLRLTKKDNIPLLSLTIITNTLTSSRPQATATTSETENAQFPSDLNADGSLGGSELPGFFSHDRETTITQSIPVLVLAAASVSQLHEPQCREPDVYIMLPPLLQLKAISERFTKLALSPETSLSKLNRPTQGGATDFSHSRLVLSANMHGVLKIGVTTSALKIESEWKGLANPELDPTVVEGGEEGIRAHASTKMKEKDGDEGWAVVRVEGRDWGRVLGVGRLGGRVIACFCHNNALILYVYLSNDDSGADDSVLTYYIASYSA